MAKVTNAFATYEAIGNREDLTDAIYNISPTETPFLTLIGRTKSKAVTHEWQTDALAAAADNAQLEGDAISRAASTPTVRLSNVCQISAKDATVTHTQEAVDKAGRKNEMSFLMAKRTSELKLDMDKALSGNQARVNGNTTTARKLAGFETWIQTNDDRGVGGADGNGGTTAPTDGTARAFTEALLKVALKKAYEAGGTPSTLMVGASNKQVVSGFAGRASARQNIGEGTILAAASLYASDFGDIKVVTSRNTRARSGLLIDPEYVAVAYLRSFERYELGKIGAADSKVVESEYTLEMRNEAAHAIVADLTTP